MAHNLNEDEMSDILSAARLKLIERAAGLRTWKHLKSERFYVASEVVLREEDLEPLVVYWPRQGRIGLRFARPLTEFLARFEPCMLPEVANGS